MLKCPECGNEDQSKFILLQQNPNDPMKDVLRCAVCKHQDTRANFTVE